MEMIELYSCEKYKVLDVFLAKGEKMPLHQATSDAFFDMQERERKNYFFGQNN